MKAAFLLVFFVFISNWCSGQDLVEHQTVYSQSISIDTNLCPDYYRVEFCISEYTVSEGKKKNTTYTLISIDSIEQMLGSILVCNSIKNDIELIKITNDENNRIGRIGNLHGHYALTINSKDEIDIFYKALNETWPDYVIKGFIVYPRLNQQTINNAKNVLEIKAQKKIQTDAQLFADSNQTQLGKIASYFVNFQQENSYHNFINKRIDISYIVPKYTLTVNCSYYLE